MRLEGGSSKGSSWETHNRQGLDRPHRSWYVQIWTCQSTCWSSSSFAINETIQPTIIVGGYTISANDVVVNAIDEKEDGDDN